MRGQPSSLSACTMSPLLDVYDVFVLGGQGYCDLRFDACMQEMMSKAQRLGPEIIAVLDSFLHTSSMAVD